MDLFLFIHRTTKCINTQHHQKYMCLLTISLIRIICAGPTIKSRCHTCLNFFNCTKTNICYRFWCNSEWNWVYRTRITTSIYSFVFWTATRTESRSQWITRTYVYTKCMNNFGEHLLLSEKKANNFIVEYWIIMPGKFLMLNLNGHFSILLTWKPITPRKKSCSTQNPI